MAATYLASKCIILQQTRTLVLQRLPRETCELVFRWDGNIREIADTSTQRVVEPSELQNSQLMGLGTLGHLRSYTPQKEGSEEA
jgi:hypothetical protein